MSVVDFNIIYAIETLERAGYIVRKPVEASIPVVLEVRTTGERMPLQHVGLRADMMLNGVPVALVEHYPVDMLLSQDPDFRNNFVPRKISRMLANYLADAMLPGIRDQVKEKVTPLVPEPQMSRAEIEAFIKNALGSLGHTGELAQSESHAGQNAS